MASTLPARPTLAAHVVARRHVVDGTEIVVLHEPLNDKVVQLGPTEWALLAAADGSRDLDGILLAAARGGTRIHRPALTALLEKLEGALMLHDGALDDPGPRQADPAPPPDTDDPGSAERTVEPLPGYTFACDGSGGCCQRYASIFFNPVEAARARALFPQVLDGGARHENVFMPDHGSGPTATSAVTLSNGRCPYLADSGLCSIHAAAGADAKPAGCNIYPVLCVDDGESVRVSPVVECACVITSAGHEGGEPLLPPEVRVRRDLPKVHLVRSLPWLVPISPDAMAPREEVVAWSRRVAEILDAAGVGPTGVASGAPAPDVAAVMMSLGALLSEGDLDAEPACAILEPAPIAPAAVLPWLEVLHRRAAQRERDAGWRSERDLVRRISRWIALSSGALLDAGTLSALLATPAAAPGSEAFYLRALLHGHQLVGALPLSRAFADRAVRILVARAMPSVFAGEPEVAPDGVRAHPLALVEAMMRGHGLGGYAFEVA